MFYRFLSALLFSSFCIFPAHSAVVKFWDYKLNTKTNIFSDGTTEWLQWDVTQGMTITEALGLYSYDGWSIASTSQMETLITSTLGFTDGFLEPHYVNEIVESVPGQNSEIDSFINLVGETYRDSSGLYGTGDASRSFSRSFYGPIDLAPYEDKDYYRYIYLGSDYIYNDQWRPGQIVSEGPANTNWPHPHTGIALTRSVKSVPELGGSFLPISVALLSGLLCLGVERRRKS